MSNAFGFLDIISNGGAALAVDASPNTTPPPTTRIMRMPRWASGDPSPSIQTQALDGTGNIVTRLWILDEGSNTWIVASSADMTSLAPPSSTSSGSAKSTYAPRAMCFMQVVSNVGNVTRLGWLMAT